jgi:ATP-binding cassette, subfamily F, member 3
VLRLDAVTVQLGERVILDRVDLSIPDRDRMAIVGRNGAGKTTLLRAAASQLTVDGGEVFLGRGQDVGVLAQEAVVAPDHTLWEEVHSALEPVLALRRRADELMDQAAGLGEDETARAGELLEEAEVLHERFRQRDGWQAEAACGRVLSGLGFERSRWHKPCGTFSGGWQVRIALARLLLEKPCFLMLDEPTNHLDIETRTWLLHELKTWPGAVVVIGHDRDFLDRLVRRTVEVGGGGVTEYSGGYSDYLASRELRIEQLKAAAASREEERARIQVFIDRFRYKASKAAQVQARVKQLERLPSIFVPTLARRADLRFPDPPPSGDPMLEIRGLSRAFGPLTVLDEVDGSVYRGERVLLVGPNGAGKSTLLRLLAGRDQADSGAIVPGPGVRTAWFAQDQAAELDPEWTVLEAVKKIDPLMTEQRLRSFLGSFLFTGDDVHKRCGILSGGERSRVALARILLRRANLLLLDEPTNHLDIETKAVLARALKDFSGAIVFVSHDRAFCDLLADRVWEVGAGRLGLHPGNLDDFLWSRAVELGVCQRRAPGESAPDAWLLGGLPAPREEGEEEPAEVPESKGDAWKDRKRRKAELDRCKRRLAELPGEIETLEATIEAVHARMADPAMATNWNGLSELQREYTALERKLEEAYAEWEALEGD